MSNDDLDIRNIVYANNCSKITLKSRRILDDLAAQVTLWNLEKHQMPLVNQYGIRNKIQVDIPNLNNDIKHQHNQNNRILKSISESNSTSFSLASRGTPLNSKGIVKKKAEYFESLLTPVHQNKIKIDTPKSSKILDFPLGINTFDICKKFLDKENKEPIVDECLPPPPEYITDFNDDLITDLYPEPFDHCIGVDEEKLGIELNPDDKNSEDFTCISSISSSLNTGSLYEEIVNELAKKQNEPDAESLPGNVLTRDEPKKVRRSLSFNDTVQYIFPNVTDESSQGSYDDSLKIQSYAENQHFIDSSQSFLNLTKSTEAQFCLVELEMEMCDLKKKSKELLENMRTVLTDLRFNLGSKAHTDICRQIVKNTLVTKSLAEKIHQGPQNYTEAIVGTLKISKIKFALKEGFVLVDYDQLVSQGYSDKLYRLTGIFHIVLYVRCVQDTVVSESRIYTLVNRKEAVKLGLKFQILDWLEMFYYINFQKLSAGFRLIFDLHCMDIIPKKYSFKYKGTPKKRTPIKEMFSNLFSDSDRSSFFTNIGSFEVSAQGLICNDNEEICKQLTVPAFYPFTGKVKYEASLNLQLLNECEGRLNIYMDVSGVGSWIYRDCKLTKTGIIGGKKCEDNTDLKDVDITIPFFMCAGEAILCDYVICAKVNSFCVLLRHIGDDKNMPINRRLSTDGRKKNRFLACAESYEDAIRWCNCINDAKTAFCQWANDIDSL